MLPTTKVPDTSKLTITNGRDLIDWQLAHLDPLKDKIGVGSTIVCPRLEASKEIVALMSCSPTSSIPFPDVREEFVNSRDAEVSIIWYAIFAGGSSCSPGAVAEGKGSVSRKQGS